VPPADAHLLLEYLAGMQGGSMSSSGSPPAPPPAPLYTTLAELHDVYSAGLNMAVGPQSPDSDHPGIEDLQIDVIGAGVTMLSVEPDYDTVGTTPIYEAAAITTIPAAQTPYEVMPVVVSTDT